MSRRIHALYTKCSFSLVLLLVAAWPALGQSSSTASVGGVVQDTSDARIANASVKLINKQTGTESSSRTNDDGAFALPSVIPGSYTLQVERDGFETTLLTGITLNVGDTRNLAIRMKVGGAAQSVTVDASGQTIDTTDATVSTVIDRQFVENLPMNGRSFQSLIYLTPGVSLNYGASASDAGQFTVNGQRASANYWIVDGVSGNIGMSSATDGTGNSASGSLGGFNVLGGTNSLVSVDALQEFRIETSTYAPEFGRTPGGQVAITTRAGTNQFHGTVFDYFRNTVLDANNWFNGYTNNPALRKAPEQQSDFGGVIGGPIIKDRTFFFFSYEGLRLNLPITAVADVPDLNARQIASPGMKPIVNAYPLPTGPEVLNPDGTPSGLASENATYSNPAKVDAYSLRIDHRLTKNLNIFGRIMHSPSSENQRGYGSTALNNFLDERINTDTATAGVTWTASPRIVNDFRFNYSRAAATYLNPTDTFGGGSTPPLDENFASGYTYSNSLADMYSGFGLHMGFDVGGGGNNEQHQYNLVDTLSWQKGTHNLKFGVDYRRLSPHEIDYIDAFFVEFLSPQQLETGDAQAYQFHHIPESFLFHNLGAYAQDTWRMNPRLTLTYGLRWDVDFAPTMLSGASFFPAITGFSTTDLSNLAPAPAGRPAFQTPYGSVAPRVGGAYQLLQTPDHPLVLRGGFGVFYDLATSEAGNVSIYNYPFGYTTTVPVAQFPIPPEDILLPAIVPPDATQGVVQGFDPHVSLPYTLEWNVALEQGLSRGETFTVSYIGSSGKRLMSTETINNPNPNYVQAVIVGNGGNSEYNALQAQFQRSLTHGLQALVSYTWSHSIDTGSNGAYTNGTFANGNQNRGDSDFDVRNAFSGALTYNVPTPTANSLTKAILGGWSMQNIVQANSAPPATVNDAEFAALEVTDASVSIRPDVVPDQPFYLSGSKYPGGKALNPAAFTNPPVGSAGQPIRQGDLGRNSLRAFGFTQWNFAVHREFPIREAIKLEFRSEMFNVLNHPSFGAYDITFNPASPDPNFGLSTQLLGQSLEPYGLDGIGGQNPLYSIGAPRSVQLALKLTF
jgi:hypothetical protein